MVTTQPSRKHATHDVLSRLACLFVDELQDLEMRPAQGLLLAPTG